MKKLILFLALSMLSAVGYSEELFTATLLDHVSTVTQIDFSGRTNLALVDSVAMAMPKNGDYILHAQAGFSGNTKPVAGEPQSADLIVGGQILLSPFFKTLIVFPEQWQFLRSVKYGPTFFYDTRDHKGHFAFQIGLAFGLNPK